MSRPYHHGDLRNELLAAGLDLLAEGGVEALTLRAAARRAGVSHAAPYRHFADKQALLEAIAEQGFADLRAAMAAAIAGAGSDPRAGVAAIARAYLRFAVERPAQFQLMFAGTKAERAAVPTLEAAVLAAFAVPLEVVADGQERGLIAAGDTESLTVTVWSLVHGVATLVNGGQLPGDDDLAGRCADVLYAGLRPPTDAGG